MRIRRILKTSLIFTALAAVAVFALPVQHWLKAEQQRRAALPHPVLATPQEFRAIIAAVLEKMDYQGVPPPPPVPGEAVRAHAAQDILISSSTLCISPESVSKPRPGCSFLPSDVLLSPELDGVAPRKLREELLLANASRHTVGLEGLPRVRVVEAAQIRQLLNDGFWRAFYARYPHTAGWAEASMPVLTPDRSHALVYMAHYCDGLCGTGTLLYLELTPTGWTVAKQEMLWIS